ncbi:unnamed protein product [Rotaria sp. Silwood1]|nr:unnamed protein product [Rotaria sp. Silwood1]CAF1323403.1 unnamed protein product [Rotaria sp. Silwood1]CAF3547418.1 unnamed protein product [Rotaria sp. Silwood1]CAF3548520.1 unnamed protein product [Rotaria sp. Silwood1]CAF4892632.1 unnamed protein product [Rotaria sp. Silwood1]
MRYNLKIDFNNFGSLYTSCSAHVCSSAPVVQLVGAIAIPGWSSQYSVDDAYVTLSLSMSLTMYDYSTSTTSVISSSFGGSTAFSYWDDLMIYSGTSQSVYYSVAGTTPNRSATLEYYTSHYG